jgi:hypothetical protein
MKIYLNLIYKKEFPVRMCTVHKFWWSKLMEQHCRSAGMMTCLGKWARLCKHGLVASYTPPPPGPTPTTTNTSTSKIRAYLNIFLTQGSIIYSLSTVLC